MNVKARKRSEPHWLVRPATIRLLWRGGLAVLAVLTLADLLLTPHPYFGIDGSFGFYSWYGLLTCAVMVFFAKGLGYFLKRDDAYYGDDGE